MREDKNKGCNSRNFDRKRRPYSPFRSANLGNFNAKKHTKIAKIAKDAKKTGVRLAICILNGFCGHGFASVQNAK